MMHINRKSMGCALRCVVQAGVELHCVHWTATATVTQQKAHKERFIIIFNRKTKTNSKKKKNEKQNYNICVHIQHSAVCTPELRKSISCSLISILYGLLLFFQEWTTAAAEKKHTHPHTPNESHN